MSKRTSPKIPVSSHLVCNQDRMREGREVVPFVLNFTPSRQFKGRKVLLLSCTETDIYPTCKGAWAFSTRANAITTYQMWPTVSSMARLFSSSRYSILLFFLSQKHRVIALPMCPLLSVSKDWGRAKILCWKWCYKKAKLTANHQLRKTEIRVPRLVASFCYLLGRYILIYQQSV